MYNSAEEHAWGDQSALLHNSALARVSTSVFDWHTVTIDPPRGPVKCSCTGSSETKKSLDECHPSIKGLTKANRFMRSKRRQKRVEKDSPPSHLHIFRGCQRGGVACFWYLVMKEGGQYLNNCLLGFPLHSLFKLVRNIWGLSA